MNQEMPMSQLTSLTEKVATAIARQEVRIGNARQALAYAEADLAQLEGIQASLEAFRQRDA